jgi:protein-S-isoprenylcysteine O-methyltransferase Ste14
MPLNEQFRAQGSFLFRWRGLLPLLLLPFALLAIAESGYFVEWVGEPIEEAWELFCLGISMLGLGLRAVTVGCAAPGTSGRNARAQRAESLNTTGIYATVRNPLYLGNFLVLLGFVLAIKIWWFVIIASLGFALYYERIIFAEEAFLRHKYGAAYTAWASRTPALIPNPRLWCAPVLRFSLRTALRREYNGFYLIVVTFTLIELVSDLLVEAQPFHKWLQNDWFWLAFFATGTLIFFTLRTMKKHTRILHVAGR